MGSKSSKTKKIATSSAVGKEINCPYCNATFHKNTTFFELNDHILNCANKNGNKPNEMKAEKTPRSERFVSEITKFEKDKYFIKKNESEKDNDKVLKSNVKPDTSLIYNNNALNTNDINLKSKQIILKKYNANLFAILEKNIKKKTYISEEPFETKYNNLRSCLEEIKVDWREAHCNLAISRENMLEDTLRKIGTIDPYKGEVSHDAGGIIREWFTVIFKKLFSYEMGLFESSDSVDFSYLVSSSSEKNERNIDYFKLIGKLVAKALLENVTINLCFNKLIYKIILTEKLCFEDLIFINKPLYNSLKVAKTMENIEDLCLFYVVDYHDKKGNLITEEIISDGSNIMVTNIDDYIEKRIDYMIAKNKIFIDYMKEELFKIIPEDFFDQFNSSEFELILNGRPFIDVEDWKNNTKYQGKYNHKHKTIKAFWKVMYSLSQEELSRFLQFSTGSPRVPIGGFEALQANRGETAKFCITPLPFDSKKKNFIRAHTCFNRIDLPMFNTEEQIKESITYILNNVLIGFGID